jgi:hypothetical protein
VVCQGKQHKEIISNSLCHICAAGKLASATTDFETVFKRLPSLDDQQMG